MGCGGSKSRRRVQPAYEGALSWSDIKSATEQAALRLYVGAYVGDPAIRSTLKKVGKNDKQAAKKLRTELRGLCGRPPIQAPSLAKIRNSVPADQRSAFDALGVDPGKLADELVACIRRFPDHYDDCDFIFEQLFAKTTVDKLTSPNNTSSAPQAGRSFATNRRTGSASSAAHQRRNSGGASTSSTWNRPLAVGARPSSGQLGRSFAQGNRGAGGIPLRERSNSVDMTRRRSGSFSHTPSMYAAGGADADEPTTPRRGSQQSIGDFEQQMDSFLVNHRRRSSEEAAKKEQAAKELEASGLQERKRPALKYLGAPTAGGSFLPELPNFGNKDPHRRRHSSETPSSARMKLARAVRAAGTAGSAPFEIREAGDDRPASEDRKHRRRSSSAEGGRRPSTGGSGGSRGGGSRGGPLHGRRRSSSAHGERRSSSTHRRRRSDSGAQGKDIVASPGMSGKISGGAAKDLDEAVAPAKTMRRRRSNVH